MLTRATPHYLSSSSERQNTKVQSHLSVSGLTNIRQKQLNFEKKILAKINKEHFSFLVTKKPSPFAGFWKMLTIDGAGGSDCRNVR